MKVYLGDAVYAAATDWGDIILTTEDGISVTNKIVLDPGVYEALYRYQKTLVKDQNIS